MPVWRCDELRADGGASANNLMMQLQADFSGVPVVRPKMRETTALGAAYLAGLAVGFWSDTSEIASQWQIDRRFEPQISADQRLAKLARWHQAVARAAQWAQPKTNPDPALAWPLRGPCAAPTRVKLAT